MVGGGKDREEMRIEIEIPVEFEEHFNQDKFKDTLHRLSADAHLLAGRYEQETAIMLIKAFADSKLAFDTEKVVEQLEEKTDFLKDCTKYGNKDAEQQEKSYSTMMMYEVTDLVEDLIDIVKKGGVE